MFKTQATPLSLLTRTDTVHTNLWRPRISLGRVGGAVDARTHGMRLGGRQYAKRRRTVHRAGPRLESTAKTETVASGPMVTLVTRRAWAR